MSAAPMQVASDRDAVWFQLHPGRTVYVRPYVEGELLASLPRGDGFLMIVVRQIRPGVRARIPAYVHTLPANSEAACLAVLRRAMRNQAADRGGAS